MNAVQIGSSILTADFLRLGEELREAEAGGAEPGDGALLHLLEQRRQGQRSDQPGSSNPTQHAERSDRVRQ